MQWFLYAILSALFAALATVFAKLGLKDIDPLLASTLRAVVMSLLMVVFMLSATGGRVPASIDYRGALFLVFSAVAGAASWILYFFALKSGEASRVAVVDRSSVLFVLVFSLLLLGEKITVYKIGAALLVFAGLVLIAL